MLDASGTALTPAVLAAGDVYYANSVNSINGSERDRLLDDTRRQYLGQAATRQYLQRWRVNQSEWILPTLKEGDGFYNPACFIHCNFGDTLPRIRGQTFMHAFDQWLLHGTRTRLVDDCGLLCGECPLCIFALSYKPDYEPVLDELESRG